MTLVAVGTLDRHELVSPGSTPSIKSAAERDEMTAAQRSLAASGVEPDDLALLAPEGSPATDSPGRPERSFRKWASTSRHLPRRVNPMDLSSRIFGLCS